MSQPLLNRVLTVLRGRAFDLTNEMRLQVQVSDALSAAAIAHRREHILGPKSRIDFLCDGGIGIEAKLAGTAKEIYRQCERYCEFDEVTCLILLTNRFMGLPQGIHGKPAYLVSLGSAWL